MCVHNDITMIITAIKDNDDYNDKSNDNYCDNHNNDHNDNYIENHNDTTMRIIMIITKISQW